MSTIDLSVFQRYNRERIRKEVAEREKAGLEDLSDQADSGRLNSTNPVVDTDDRISKTVPVNEPDQSSANRTGGSPLSSVGNSSNNPDFIHQNNPGTEIPQVNPHDGTEQMTSEEREEYLKEHVRREEIKNNWAVELKRIEAAREHAEIEIDTKRQQAKLKAERDLLAEEAKTLDLRNQMERQDIETRQMRLDQESQGINNREREHQLAVEQRKDDSEARRQKINRIFRACLMALFVILLLIILAAIAHRMWRWSVEEPLIKEVIEEVVVEKRVIKEVIKEVEVEKEVIPPECTQIRRNGMVYVSCDGVSIDGVPTISESGVEVPELLGDPDQQQ